MEKTLDTIKLFSSMDPGERQHLAGLCTWRSMKKGEQIFSSGSDSRDVFFVAEGAVSVLSAGQGQRNVSFATIPAGDYFGELSAIDGQPRSASIVCAQDGLLASLDQDRFNELLKSQAGVAFAVLSRLARVIRRGDERIVELSTLAANQRVFAELLRSAQPDAAVPGLWVVRPLPPMHEIAALVSTTRETVARAISQLYKTGLAKRKGRNFYLLDRAKLESLIDALKANSK